eukprot:c23207_g1_i1.p1 GENE.c23207_g1_i1~~c23207_g1_i1.p1  ORF type:complete len:326 (+),score=69.13 c23207_g1_i1:98-979(+)
MMSTSLIPRAFTKRTIHVIAQNSALVSTTWKANRHTKTAVSASTGKIKPFQSSPPNLQQNTTGALWTKDESSPSLPRYLVDTYTWAYLTKENMNFLDTNLVVSGILWGNANRLMKSAAQEFAPGMRVLQPACVYGTFSNMLAEQLGEEGHLLVSDVAPVQLERLQPKVAHLKNVTLALADARSPVGAPFDGVCCFFLLHEVPDDVKADIVKSLFRVLKPGGKIVFVDYHKPIALHPLKMVMSVVFDVLEPFAKALWTTEIKELCPNPENYTWTKETMFGGMYQKVIAQCSSSQ